MSDCYLLSHPQDLEVFRRERRISALVTSRAMII
jgi:hypothetical protein